MLRRPGRSNVRHWTQRSCSRNVQFCVLQDGVQYFRTGCPGPVIRILRFGPSIDNFCDSITHAPCLLHSLDSLAILGRRERHIALARPNRTPGVRNLETRRKPATLQAIGAGVYMCKYVHVGVGVSARCVFLSFVFESCLLALYTAVQGRPSNKKIQKVPSCLPFKNKKMGDGKYLCTFL